MDAEPYRVATTEAQNAWSSRDSRRLQIVPEPYRDRVATTEAQNAWSSRDSRRLQIVPGSALAGNSNCKNKVTELRFLVISRQ